MARIIHVAPLSVAAYARYGGVISTDVVNEKTVSVNGGTARRTPEVVPTENLYRNAASGIPGRAVLNVSLASPRETTAWSGAAGNGEEEKRVLKIKVLERHRYSTQSFIPMGTGVKYLVVVTDGEDEPNLDGLKAFIATDKQGVCYGTAVWHVPMSIVGDQVSSN
jgi:ureidoglycolate hydrolase